MESVSRKQVVLFVALCLMISAAAQGQLRALWSFDEGTGTVASDASGNGNTETLTGPNISWSGGKYGSAINLVNDGANVSYVDVDSTDPKLLIGQTATDSWTIALWAYEMSSGGAYVATYGRMVHIDMAAAGTARFHVESGTTGDDQIYIWSDYNNAYRIGTGLSQVFDQWVHHAAVQKRYDGFI